MKIVIIGNCGSGKSTLGAQLHRILNIPLYHIDQYFFKPGWQKVDREEFEKIHHQLCEQSNWIIEGMATRLLEYRIKQADIIIFLDVPTTLCLYRIFKRCVTYYGKTYFSSAPGCTERFPDFEFLRYVYNFNKKKKPEIERLLQEHAVEKKIYIIKKKRELENLIAHFIVHPFVKTRN